MTEGITAPVNDPGRDRGRRGGEGHGTLHVASVMAERPSNAAEFLRGIASLEGGLTPDRIRWAGEEALAVLEGLEIGLRSEFEDWTGRSGVGEGLVRPEAILAIEAALDGVLTEVRLERAAIEAAVKPRGESVQHVAVYDLHDNAHASCRPEGEKIGKQGMQAPAIVDECGKCAAK